MLDVRDLRVVYPNGNEALKSISFTANAGDIIAVIGRSGAGKSTLLRCINGLQESTAGSITLDGETITSLRGEKLRKARRYIGFVSAISASSGRSTTWSSGYLPSPMC